MQYLMNLAGPALGLKPAKKEAKKRKRLAENFPGFDFPGYAGAAQGARRPDDDGAPTKKKKAADPEKKAAKKAKKAKK